MKKLILFMFTALIAVSASAQDLERSKFFDNTFIGVSTGGGFWLHPHENGWSEFDDGIHNVSSVRLGKWFTPSVGGQVFYEFGLNTRPLYTQFGINTMPSYNETSFNASDFLESSFVGADFLVNFSNAVGGYKGEPRRVEFVPFIGGGWHRLHNLGNDNIAARAGLQLDINLGQKKAWQLNIIPKITYILTDDGFGEANPQPRFSAARSFVDIQAGFTYKFKTSNGTHNFKLSDKEFTQADLDVYLNENAALKKGLNAARDTNLALQETNSHLIKENDRLVTELEAARRALNAKVAPISKQVVGFTIGNSDLLSVNRGSILAIADELKNNKDLNLVVVGFADAKTGNVTRNMELSKARAEAVKKALVAAGVDASRITVEAKGDTIQPFAENDANRAVIFTMKN